MGMYPDRGRCAVAGPRCLTVDTTKRRWCNTKCEACKRFACRECSAYQEWSPKGFYLGPKRICIGLKRICADCAAGKTPSS
jgi:hypothetical protein